MAKPRDYKAEYERRIQRGLERGLSRSQARVHPGKGESPASQTTSQPKYDRRLEHGLKGMREGKTLQSAARSIRVAPERLRGYIARTGVAEKRGGRWIITDDRRERVVQIYSDGKSQQITVAGYDEAVEVGLYMVAVKQFLATNDAQHLSPFVDKAITDTNGKTYTYETRPNVLYKLDAVGAEPFEQVYRIVA